MNISKENSCTTVTPYPKHRQATSSESILKPTTEVSSLLPVVDPPMWIHSSYHRPESRQLGYNRPIISPCEGIQHPSGYGIRHVPIIQYPGLT